MVSGQPLGVPGCLGACLTSSFGSLARRQRTEPRPAASHRRCRAPPPHSSAAAPSSISCSKIGSMVFLRCCGSVMLERSGPHVEQTRHCVAVHSRYSRAAQRQVQSQKRRRVRVAFSVQHRSDWYHSRGMRQQSKRSRKSASRKTIKYRHFCIPKS